MAEDKLMTLDSVTGEIVAMPEDEMNIFYNEMAQFSTRTPQTFDEKLEYLAIIQNAEKMKDGQAINLADIYATQTMINDKQTGGKVKKVFMIFIDDKGKGWFSLSEGVLHSVPELFAAFGNPNNGGKWDKPIPVKLEKLETRDGNTVKKLVVNVK